MKQRNRRVYQNGCFMYLAFGTLWCGGEGITEHKCTQVIQHRYTCCSKSGCKKLPPSYLMNFLGKGWRLRIGGGPEFGRAIGLRRKLIKENGETSSNATTLKYPALQTTSDWLVHYIHLCFTSVLNINCKSCVHFRKVSVLHVIAVDTIIEVILDVSTMLK